MTAPEADLMTTCPGDVEELAAFIDGRLTSERRARVVEHLATCADCRDIVMTADEFAVAEGAVPSNVVRGKFFQRVAIPAAAAAAIVTGLFLGPLGKSGMEKLVAAAEHEKVRPIAARFSADFPYRDHRVNRGGGEPEPLDEFAMDGTAAEVAQVDDNDSAKKLHAAGVALLYLEADYHDEAVKRLEQAAKKRPNDAAILTDLSAAYSAVGKGALALQTADRALAIEETPVAVWNRAVALDVLRRDADAEVAWRRYLQLDPASEWAAEIEQDLKLRQ